MKKKCQIFLQMLLVTCLALSMVGYFVIAYFNIPIADDYCNKMFLQKTGGLFNYVAEVYMTWTGRVVTSALLGALLNLTDFSQIRLLTMLMATIFCTMSYFIARSVYPKNNMDTLFLVCWGLVCWALWFGLGSISGQIIFWPTGAVVYLVPTFFGVLFLSYFKKLIQKDQLSRWDYICVSLSSLFIGLLVEVLSPPAVLFVVAYPLAMKYFKELALTQPRIKAIFLSFIMLIAGTLILILAPGNFSRAKYGAGSFKISSLTDLVVNLYQAYFKSIQFNKTFFLYTTFAVCMIILIRLMAGSRGATRGNLIFFTLVIVSAFMAPLPFIFVPDFVGDRASIVFSIFTMIGVLGLSWNIPISSLGKTPAFYIVIIPSFLLIVVFRSQMVEAQKYKKLYVWNQQRHLQIKASIIKRNIIIDSFSGVLPDRIFFSDVTVDPENWINKCVADFYNLETIRTNK